jgi:1-acyl-sn-glycerol-3-phosphate acyltransferase
MCFWAVLLSPFDRNGRKIHFYAAVPWAKGVLWACGVKVSAKGVENIDPKVPRIYMTNHQSYFDIYALFANIPVDFRFILKQEFMKVPGFGFTLRRARHIGIQRDDPRKAVESIKQAVEQIKNGQSVAIFPEGTRSVDGRLQPFKRGGFNLALRSGCDIVPVAMSNSYRIQPKGSLRINKGSFSMHIGKPISVKGYTKKNMAQLMDRVREEMLSLMGENSPAKHDNGQQATDN